MQFVLGGGFYGFEVGSRHSSGVCLFISTTICSPTSNAGFRTRARPAPRRRSGPSLKLAPEGAITGVAPDTGAHYTIRVSAKPTAGQKTIFDLYWCWRGSYTFRLLKLSHEGCRFIHPVLSTASKVFFHISSYCSDGC